MLINQKFHANYNLPEWCLVECDKLIRSGVKARVVFKLHFLTLLSLFVFPAPDSFINHLKLFIMEKQAANKVYDSFSDKHWNMETFFEKLADYYNGNLNELSEQLITAIEALNHMPDDAILSEMAKASTLNLLIVRECLQGIEIKPDTENYD